MRRYRGSAEPWLLADAITFLASGDFCPLLIPESVHERIVLKVKKHAKMKYKSLEMTHVSKYLRQILYIGSYMSAHVLLNLLNS